MAFLSLANEMKTRRQEVKTGKRPETPPPGYATETWGTSNRFAHYPDNKLTRAALALVNSNREERGLEPLNSPAAVLYRFCSIPAERHARRAVRLYNRYLRLNS